MYFSLRFFPISNPWKLTLIEKKVRVGEEPDQQSHGVRIQQKKKCTKFNETEYFIKLLILRHLSSVVSHKNIFDQKRYQHLLSLSYDSTHLNKLIKDTSALERENLVETHLRKLRAVYTSIARYGVCHGLAKGLAQKSMTQATCSAPACYGFPWPRRGSRSATPLSAATVLQYRVVVINSARVNRTIVKKTVSQTLKKNVLRTDNGRSPLRTSKSRVPSFFTTTKNTSGSTSIYSTTN